MGTKRHAGPKRKGRSATAEVLGRTPSPERVPPRWRKHHGHLLELYDALVNSRTRLARDALEEQPSYSTHMADAATDTFDRDFALGLLSSEQDALYEIEEALERIRDGTYAICELTSKPIEPEAIPWTRFSAAASKKLEEEGALKRARLGPRESVSREEPSEPEEE
ncbi:Transcriptional regulator, TraR/DksA family [Verrucomicrobia bacterium]|nr:Transcriptional regulator, TraR/DksA family [Verrucomicrobiota bacterium]